MSPDLDLLEEPTVEEAHPETLDLDSLLLEAVSLAEAKKTSRKSGKPRQDPALADIAQAAEAALVWVAEYAVAKFTETHCSCGASHRAFDGWFVVSNHKRDPHAKRFIRSADHHDLPSWQYTSLQEVDYCTDCVSELDLPRATLELRTGIDALGTPAECCRPSYDQQELSLEEQEEEDWIEAEEALDDMQDKHLWEGIDNAA